MGWQRSLKARVAQLAVGVSIATAGLVVPAAVLAATGSCSGATTTVPFNDVSGNPFFCQIASAYFSGLTSGTSATTYSPTDPVTREQMAAFVTRTLDQSLSRGSRRGALDQWWTPSSGAVPKTTVGNLPVAVVSDGADLWVGNYSSGTISRVRASDGRVLGTWTGASGVTDVLVARGRVYAIGDAGIGSLWVLNPTTAPGAVTLLDSGLGIEPEAMAFDGTRIWIAHHSNKLTRIGFGGFCVPVCVASYTTGFTSLGGAVFDGFDLWVSDTGDDRLKRVETDGSISATRAVGDFPTRAIFDGMNIWVPNEVSDNVTVLRVRTPAGSPLASTFVVATLSGNGLDRPVAAAFDGERIAVANFQNGNVSLWQATDLTPLGFVSLSSATFPRDVASDGLNFWVTLGDTDQLAKL